MDPWVRIAAPGDVGMLKATDPDRAGRWRQTHRRAFTWYLSRGYRVAGFQHVPSPADSHYLLTKVAESTP